MFSEEQAIADINERNRRRRDARIPLLSVESELRRLKKVADDAAFEEFYKTESPRFADRYDAERGLMYNMLIQSEIRGRLRGLFNAVRMRRPSASDACSLA